MTSLNSLHDTLSPLLSPLHPSFPFAPIDIIGAMRLSSVINWIATGVFDPQPTGKGKKGIKKERASIWQELAGLMIVVFGGETFLAMCTGTTPSWLVTPNIVVLFCAIHILQTRTPFIHLLPTRPSLPLELLLAIPDAIGRTLLLTRFSIIPLLYPSSPSVKTLPATSISLVLVPFILAVPFASIAFSTFNFFSPTLKLTTPVELKSQGWMLVDTWCPLLISPLFLTLIGPVEGWNIGSGWGEHESVICCMVVLWACFTGRAVYNFGYRRDHWSEMFGVRGEKKKTE
ncbi:hypothetical protein L486_03216 [Kwoniella mangroviensis CBS 10435]|uniref:Uncharacterized protein n=1 Tax=Kwoniella mangroviensis CBS 10435 TaxID=1331196 RepID=A0A1B9IT72_9TREE|nr:uncharacterized protein I203_01897 [Kwoniella mangroviensis CBS 8507]OCF58726.1 hypothetical protein L486_03216 [Kwoniella mangroviensis CBS 10435]OCF68514.1 hypothetical protein I203_01897 [Kwoniella mangroviensis CBS 8507]OCF77024.1 hypothetical protein I204_02733 [Kwoniella mangroviensis CBS 8886]